MAISAARTLAGVSIAGMQMSMFSAGPTFVPCRAVRPDRLHGKAMPKRHVVTDLIYFLLRQGEARRVDTRCRSPPEQASRIH